VTRGLETRLTLELLEIGGQGDSSLHLPTQTNGWQGLISLPFIF